MDTINVRFISQISKKKCTIHNSGSKIPKCGSE